MTLERKAALIQFAQREVEQFKQGSLERLSAYEELRERFGYGNRWSVYNALHSAKVVASRIKALGLKRAEFAEDMVPSRDYAWILGLVAGGGTVATDRRNYCSFTSSDPKLANAFRETGERLFHTNASVINEGPPRYSKEYIRVSFHGRDFQSILGDLRRTVWPETVRNQHEWVLSEPRFTWSFLEGLFETRGNVQAEDLRRYITLRTDYRAVAYFIIDLLTRVGVQNPKLIPIKDRPDHIRGVMLTHREDLKLFASNVHSRTDTTEQRLDFYRQTEFRTPPSIVESNDEVVQEWRKVKELVGGIPTSKQINKLRTQGKTKFAFTVYLKRFGGKFVKARQKLEEIVFAEDVNNTLKEYEEHSGVQVRYAPKKGVTRNV